jgi:hypothetical protein
MDDDERSSEGSDLDRLLDGLDKGSLLEHLTQVQTVLAAERAAAAALCTELLALSGDHQEEEARREPRFRTWGVCENLLLRSADPETEPAEAVRIAALALTVAAGLDTVVHTAAMVRDLQARACAGLGQARLRTGDGDGAEHALTEAASHLAHGTGDLLVEACLLELEAAVRRRQGRPREAAALLRQAETRYREIGETELAAQARQAREESLAAAQSMKR